MRSPVDPFGAVAEVSVAGQTVKVSRLAAVEEAGLGDLRRLPYSVRVLLENALRSASAGIVTEAQVRALAAWDPQAATRPELPFMPSRVVLQDFTGVPCVVDLAAMRGAVARRGGDPAVINPTVPVDLVIDHSVQVDQFGTEGSYAANVRLEMERNVERYGLLRWAQQEYCDLRVVPPGMGIVHQVNLEFLAPVVRVARTGRDLWAYPDTVIGTDSHTTMINGLGVLGWGVGGIEAEAVMLGQPYGMLVPQVVGVRLLGKLPVGSTATDLVLAVTSLLRSLGVVGRFVEYFGPGLAGLSLPDRATIANMSPEYGATVGYFPVDEQTIAYLRLTGRPEEHVRLVYEYCRLQRLYRDAEDPEPEYSQVVELDLGGVRPSVAGPRRPQDMLPLDRVPQNFLLALPAMALAGGRADTTVCSAEVCLVGAHEEVLDRLEDEGGRPEGELFEEPSAGEVEIPVGREKWITLKDGAVVIAAITSCTNTSNPSVMIGAGLLARNAVRRGLSVAPWVKTSLAPGSRVVTGYLERSGLLPYLEALHFQIVGYGCTTCIGNSGPLNGPVARAIRDDQLVVASVLSGNRNFEGRIHPLVRANYLMSPALVVAYALAGNVDVDLVKDPLGFDPNGAPVYLRDLWPSDEEVTHLVKTALNPDLVRERYSTVFAGDASWQELAVPRGALYAWQESSTYVKEPPFFDDFDPEEPAVPADIRGGRLLCVFGDSVTTDHISPAGSIPPDSPAGRYLVSQGVPPARFNTYGSRRGNHEVMMRGTFANLRLRNLMVEQEGGWTVHQPSGELLPIFDAALWYAEEKVPLIVVAGKEYGTGSSRDWAAKGPSLLGVRAVLAESYERIHRSNLVGMGILPLQFPPGTDARTLGLTGDEVIDVLGLGDLRPGAEVPVVVHRAGAAGSAPETVLMVARLESPTEVEYLRHGGILPRVLRLMLGGDGGATMSDSAEKSPRIQVLRSSGCDESRTAEAREALRQALGEVGLQDHPVEEVLIETEEQSVTYGMVGGPAIMVDGVDVDPGVRGMRTGGLGCRAYIDSDGIHAAPPVAMIVAALRESLGQA